LASFGLTLADYNASDELHVWPEHEKAVRVFFSMQTQWIIGFSGATGLNYASLPAVYVGLGIADDEIPEIFSQFQVIEKTYLAQIKQKQPAK
jgi:hypothetical protein